MYLTRHMLVCVRVCLYLLRYLYWSGRVRVCVCMSVDSVSVSVVIKAWMSINENASVCVRHDQGLYPPGKRKSKLKTLKTRLFGRSKRETKLSQSTGDVTEAEGLGSAEHL